MKALIAILCLATSAWGQAPKQNWHTLVHQGKFTQAKTLCTTMTKAESLAVRVDAEKCLANVALGQASGISAGGNPEGGVSFAEGFSPEAVASALIHLNRALALAPQDLSIHQGRLHVLEVSHQYEAMVKAIDESATIYKGPNALDSWLAYDGELAAAGQYEAGIRFTEVLNRHYPNSHDVVGNMGAFQSRMGHFEQALPSLREAVALAPKDPIDTWNLGQAYARLDRIPEADQWLSTSLKLDPTSSPSDDRQCLYGKFTVEKLKQREKGCALIKASCEAGDQAACAPK